MKVFLIAIALFALPGCATTEKTIDNKPVRHARRTHKTHCTATLAYADTYDLVCK